MEDLTLKKKVFLDFSKYIQQVNKHHHIQNMVPCPSQCFCLCHFTRILNPSLITPSLAGVLTFCFKVETEATSSDVSPVITFRLSLPSPFFTSFLYVITFFLSDLEKEINFRLTSSASSGSRVFTSWVFVLPLSTLSVRSFFYHINKPQGLPCWSSGEESTL